MVLWTVDSAGHYWHCASYAA